MALETFLLENIANLGVSLADYIFIFTLFPSILFTATEFRFGLYVMFIIHGFELAFFTLWGLSTTKVVIMAFILLVLMTLTIIMTNRSTRGSY